MSSRTGILGTVRRSAACLCRYSRRRTRCSGSEALWGDLRRAVEIAVLDRHHAVEQPAGARMVDQGVPHRRRERQTLQRNEHRGVGESVEDGEQAEREQLRLRTVLAPSGLLAEARAHERGEEQLARLVAHFGEDRQESTSYATARCRATRRLA